jgi:hypothetical protein
MDKYGLIVVAEDGKVAQVEKVSHATAMELLQSMGRIASVGTSLGSFSVSVQMLKCLLVEFGDELKQRKGKLDADPHFWMPMTLEKHAYLHLMAEKGIPEHLSAQHHDRMQSMLQKFHSLDAGAQMDVFGTVNVGDGMYWWDYGQLRMYQKNNMLITQSTTEASMLRMFLGIGAARVKDSTVINTVVDR